MKPLGGLSLNGKYNEPLDGLLLNGKYNEPLDGMLLNGATDLSIKWYHLPIY